MKTELRHSANSVIETLPLPWKIVFAPTDLSEPSRCAIKTAAAFAQMCRAKLILFHVVQCPKCASFDLPPDAEKMMTQARQSLDEIARTIPPDVAIEMVVRFGATAPVDEIIEEADHAAADLIVIATHGYNGLKRALLGSTAERVLRHAHCPVLVVRRSSDGSGESRTPKEPDNPFSS
ncbi:MAG TPA: universal stress protein [Candidatus Sulfotelmatobacter sp.]|nr:universal stress protein [Candidatus Sulfotelmatobacter sp.]